MKKRPPPFTFSKGGGRFFQVQEILNLMTLAYTHEDFPDTAFMQYQERGEVFFTMIGLEDYHRIKMEYWTGTNNYVTTCRGGKTIYLHRELCPRLQKGQYAHHKSSRFDNRPGILEAVTPKDHDQHRTYYGDLVIDVK